MRVLMLLLVGLAIAGPAAATECVDQYTPFTSLMSTYPMDHQIIDSDIVGDYLALLDDQGDVRVFSAGPYLSSVGQVFVRTGSRQVLAVGDSWLLVVSDDGAIHAVDLSRPATPTVHHDVVIDVDVRVWTESFGYLIVASDPPTLASYRVGSLPDVAFVDSLTLPALAAPDEGLNAMNVRCIAANGGQVAILGDLVDDRGYEYRFDYLGLFEIDLSPDGGGLSNLSQKRVDGWDGVALAGLAVVGDQFWCGYQRSWVVEGDRPWDFYTGYEFRVLQVDRNEDGDVGWDTVFKPDHFIDDIKFVEPDHILTAFHDFREVYSIANRDSIRKVGKISDEESVVMASGSGRSVFLANAGGTELQLHTLNVNSDFQIVDADALPAGTATDRVTLGPAAVAAIDSDYGCDPGACWNLIQIYGVDEDGDVFPGWRGAPGYLGSCQFVRDDRVVISYAVFGGPGQHDIIDWKTGEQLGQAPSGWFPRGAYSDRIQARELEPDVELWDWTPVVPILAGAIRDVELAHYSGMVFFGDLLYLSTISEAVPTLEIYDVSDPASPIPMGSVTEGFDKPLGGFSINGELLHANYRLDSGLLAYIAFDISDPLHPVAAGPIQYPGVILGDVTVHARSDTLFVDSCLSWDDCRSLGFLVHSRPILSFSRINGHLVLVDHVGVTTIKPPCPEPLPALVSYFDIVPVVSGGFDLTWSYADRQNAARWDLVLEWSSGKSSIPFQLLDGVSASTSLSHGDLAGKPNPRLGLYYKGDSGWWELVDSWALTEIPSVAALQEFRVFPNPFNPQTTVSFTLGRMVEVDLKIFDMAGRALRTLDHADYHVGKNSVVWDGRDDAGRALGSGAYLIQIKADDVVQSRKVLLLR